MDFNLNQIVEQMIEKGYITIIKGKLKTTGKLDREYIPSTTLTTVKKELELSDIKPVLTQLDKNTAIKELLKKFRDDAEIPFRIKGSSGQTYTVSAISVEAIKAFSEIIQSGIDYQTLVYSTKLYYKRDSFRKILTNYLKDGDWEVEYNEFKSKMDKGLIQNHIKGELGQNQSNVESI